MALPPSHGCRLLVPPVRVGHGAGPQPAGGSTSVRRRPAWRHQVVPCNPAAPAHPRAVFVYRYRGFIYTSFQERATKISHGNVGKLLAGAGDQFGAKICARIAGDEAHCPRPHPVTPPPPRFLLLPPPDPRLQPPPPPAAPSSTDSLTTGAPREGVPALRRASARARPRWCGQPVDRWRCVWLPTLVWRDGQRLA